MHRFLLLATLELDNLQFDGSLGTSGIGKAEPARVEVAAAEEAEVPVLIFPVDGLLEVYEGEAESGGKEEGFVSLGGRLRVALVFDDGCREACGVRYVQDLLSSCVRACLLVGEDVLGGRFVAVCLDGHGGGGKRGWLGVWDLGCLWCVEGALFCVENASF